MQRGLRLPLRTKANDNRLVILRARWCLSIFCVDVLENPVWENPLIRFLVFLFAGIVLLGLSSYLYLRRMGLDNKGTTISQSITLAFVQRNMYRIADAEREQLTTQSECFSVDELISLGKVDPADQERGGYSFSIECDGGGTDFTVTGRHAPVPYNSSLRWPVLVVDQTMAFSELN
jgi:hypothetical protein